MKILKFNESASKYYDQDIYGRAPSIIKSDNISSEEFNYIKSFTGSLQYDPLQWLDSIIKKINYKNLEKLSNEKKLDNLNEYIKKWKQINNLLNKIDNIKKGIDYLYTDAINETLYAIQEDMLKNDFLLFHKTWIEGYEYKGDKYEGEGYETFIIHPEIYDKYKKEIKNNLKVLLSSNKYNI